MKSSKKKNCASFPGKNVQQILNLGKYQTHIKNRLQSWKEINFNQRLWAKDPFLWFSKPVPEITDRLGWLVLPEIMLKQLEELVSFAEEIKAQGISHIVLLGMGGSSLAPEVFQKTFGNKAGFPELIVLDSTHPVAVRSVEDKINPGRTLFLVSSKSGTTLETISLFRYFWMKTNQHTKNPGRNFVAITDPDTHLIQLAQEKDFRQVFLSTPDSGGRYSAFTVFGLVPAALIGMDIHRFLERALIASKNSSLYVSEEKASGLSLGAALGELAKSRNKLTFFTSPTLRSFPEWLEQLIAESTGKNGKGIVPIVNEPLVSLNFYREDRAFVFLFLEGEETEELKDRIAALEADGHPTVRISLADKADLAQEIFRWEIAVAAAGAVLGIHPFNQPDVQLTKELTRIEMEKRNESIAQIEKGVETVSAEEPMVLAEALNNWMEKARPGDYISLQAYVSPTQEVTGALQKVRLGFLKRLQLATTMGYGPRFLHSTGQLHKGGPKRGLFLQLVDEPEIDLPVPETDFTFAALIQAQSVGDYKALKQRGQRVLRINLKKDVLGGLEHLTALIGDRG